MKTNFEELIPPAILFNLRQIENMGLIKISMSKKLIGQKKLEMVKIGQKIYLSRLELIRYLEANTIPAAG